MAVEQVKVVKNILTGNDEVAQKNRRRLDDAGVFAINGLASPGFGRTTLITRYIAALADSARLGVGEGDLASSIDTETVLAAGAAGAVQINTGGGCHLEANMVGAALDNFDLS